jgi:hypothetical protein
MALSRGQNIPGHQKRIIVSFLPLDSPLDVPCVNLFTSTIDPDFDGLANVIDANIDGINSISGKHAAASTSQKLNVFFSQKIVA